MNEGLTWLEQNEGE